MTTDRDETLLTYATERQAEYMKAYWEHGSYTKAAAALGVSDRNISLAFARVKAKAAQQGHSPEHDMTRQVPDGFKLRGVSTLYDKEGKMAAQWVKSSADRDRQAAMIIEAINGMADELPRLLPRAETPEGLSKTLMACYPIGDLHVGMLAWAEESGESYDLKIAEQVQCSAMAMLVETSPACEQAVIINLGDWFHADNLEGVTTRSGHRLDVDGRYAKMARVGVKIMRQCIESALSKHGTVRVINAVGNHDDTTSMMLAICLANIYENEPRVVIDTNPGAFHYFRHGRTLVGIHHGHSTRAERLPGVMANDRAKDWGDTDHRYWWCGHVHHQSLKDYSGVTVETFRTLAAKDAYAAWGGYRAPRDMKCILLHAKHGEVARHTVSAGMVDYAA